MTRILFSDPAWKTTFPFLVEPLTDEWLVGLLLRCDAVNHWGSGTSLTHIYRRNEKTTSGDQTFIAPSEFPFNDLADALAVPSEALVTTTYLAELARIYGIADPQAKFLQTSFIFRLCPVCVAEQRLLTRTLVLPHITICPTHQMVLVTTCLCGAALRPFHQQAPPFRCFKCSLDWAELPKIQADQTRFEIEVQLLSYYQFFWTYGTPAILESALRLSYDSVVEKGEMRAPLSDHIPWPESSSRAYRRTSSLGYVVHLLWQMNLTPSDIFVYAGPLPWRSAKWTSFHCEAACCPYVAMIEERRNLVEEERPGTVTPLLNMCEPSKNGSPLS